MGIIVVAWDGGREGRGMDRQGRKRAKSEVLPGFWQESRAHSTDQPASRLQLTCPYNSPTPEMGKVELPAGLFRDLIHTPCCELVLSLWILESGQVAMAKPGKVCFYSTWAGW